MKKIIYICNVDWFFISHRLPIALEAIKSGYEVHVLCSISGNEDYLESYNIKVHPIPLTRSGVGLISELLLFKKIFLLIKKLNPDIIHMVTIKSVIYGGVASRLLKVNKRFASISGLGYIFIENSLRVKVIRCVVKKLYKFALNSTSMTVIFQNKSDEAYFSENKIAPLSLHTIIRGSGVDLTIFRYTPEQTGQKVVMFLARLLKDKGVLEFCRVAKLMHGSVDAKFVLVGDIDAENPNSLTYDELNYFLDLGVVEHWGFSDNVQDVIPKSHIMVLPSYREGLPKSLIEAAACGRAVVTTDVPGCRDAIESNTGILVPMKSEIELRDAIYSLLIDDERRIKMGIAGRRLAESSFDIKNVVIKHIEMYEE